jgi:cell division septation protein DedD
MRMLEEIFAEVVDKNARVADNGRILDPRGTLLQSYESGGLPAYLEFEAPAAATYFTLEVNGSVIHQPLSDSATVPAGSVATTISAPPAATSSAASVNSAAKTPAAKAPTPQPPAAEEDDADAEWRGIELELAPDKGEPPDVDLTQSEDGKN